MLAYVNNARALARTQTVESLPTAAAVCGWRAVFQSGHIYTSGDGGVDAWFQGRDDGGVDLTELCVGGGGHEVSLCYLSGGWCLMVLDAVLDRVPFLEEMAVAFEGNPAREAVLEFYAALLASFDLVPTPRVRLLAS